MILAGMSWSGRERNCCFLNQGNGQFANISAAAGLDHIEDGRAYALVDWDHDGDLDMWLTNRTAPRVRFLRNDTPTDHHFLKIALAGNGTTTNRDAIGARVELVLKDRPGEKLIQALRGGEGYLAQSSKWLHFGLGKAKQIERVTVRWPGGQTEEFTGIEADRHWRLVQGRGVAEPWTPPARSVELTPSEPELPPESQQAATLLSWRIPLPALEYKTFEGAQVVVRKQAGGPVLLTLWASWCRPCVKELGELARRQPELEAAGLDVVAVSVDGLSENATTDEQAARALLARLNFPYASGLATPELVDKLQISHDNLFGVRGQLPVPTSLLIDGEGRLAAIYKGPVEVERLLADVGKLSLEGDALLAASLPFAGRWHAYPVPQARVMPLVRKLFAQGYVDEVRQYMAEHAALMPAGSKRADLLTAIGNKLLDRGDLEAARRHFVAALKLQPKYADAHNNIGLVYFRQGKLPAAAEEFERALEIEPDYVHAHVNLGSVLLRQGKLPGGLAHLRRAIELDPEFAEAHRLLGMIYRQQGKLDEAAAQLERATKADPEHVEAHYLLGQTRQQQNDLAAAAAEYERVIELKPKHVRARHRLGYLRQREGNLGEAVLHYREVLKVAPKTLAAANSLAWILATSSDPNLRDGPEALRWAKQCAEATDYGQPGVLATLAAASAETGQFEEARKWQTKAIELAPAAAQEELRRVLDLYRAGKTMREGEEGKQ